ncbi:hypothetical protein [Asticcacaulis sp. AND118]|uniref:hypothetical protein n=1 Tax=Asticcacaulis sp. AND118 TaxID=2840468 RepID=UPI001CFFD459|nr:hypothetical protein [Asticcacaulis sp. AND118]UDF02973.1 hypothetical protein LH365_11090 [Asticcacaulis sp. AND118]
MWDRWWIRIPVAGIYGAFVLATGSWLSIVGWRFWPVVSNELDFVGGSRVHLNWIAILVFVLPAIAIAELYGLIRKRHLWTSAYLIYFTVFAVVLIGGLMVVMSYVLALSVFWMDYYPLAITMLAVFSGLLATRSYLRARQKKALATLPEVNIF